MDLLPDHLHALAQSDSASEELAELYQQAEHVAMLRMPYNIPSGQSFSPFRKNLFGDLTRHVVPNNSRWAGSTTYAFILALTVIPLMHLPALPPDSPLLVSILMALFLLLILTLLTIAFAPFIFLVATLYQFVLPYGRGALKAIKSPSAICLAPLSIKFVWIQGLRFFRPRVHGWERTVGWEEILGVDCQEGAEGMPLIVITARIMHRNESFPVHLAGLANHADRLAFLRALDAHLSPERKSSAFRELLGAPELREFLLSKPSATFESSDPVAQLFLTSEEKSIK